MKKLTKKAIKEAANYLVMIDNKNNPRLYTDVLEAKTLIEAMDEATGYFNADTYLLAILEKTEETFDNEGIIYREILQSRTEGRWATMTACNRIEGSTWVRYLYDDGDDLTAILTCPR